MFCNIAVYLLTFPMYTIGGQWACWAHAVAAGARADGTDSMAGRRLVLLRHSARPGDRKRGSSRVHRGRPYRAHGNNIAAIYPNGTRPDLPICEGTARKHWMYYNTDLISFSQSFLKANHIVLTWLVNIHVFFTQRLAKQLLWFQPGDLVIALHPGYVESYAPAKVRGVYANGVDVIFYDDTCARLNFSRAFEISRDVHDEVADYIHNCERELEGATALVMDAERGCCVPST